MANKIAWVVAAFLVALALSGVIWLFLWNVCLIPVALALGGTVATIGYWTAVKVAILWMIIGLLFRAKK